MGWQRVSFLHCSQPRRALCGYAEQAVYELPGREGSARDAMGLWVCDAGKAVKQAWRCSGGQSGPGALGREPCASGSPPYLRGTQSASIHPPGLQGSSPDCFCNQVASRRVTLSVCEKSPRDQGAPDSRNRTWCEANICFARPGHGNAGGNAAVKRGCCGLARAAVTGCHMVTCVHQGRVFACMEISGACGLSGYNRW